MQRLASVSSVRLRRPQSIYVSPYWSKFSAKMTVIGGLVVVQVDTYRISEGVAEMSMAARKPASFHVPLIDATSQPVGRFKLENRRKAPRNGIEPTIGRSTTGQLRMSQQTFDIRISRRDDLPRTQFSEDQSHFPVSRIRVPDTRRARYFLRHPSPTPSGLGFKPAEERRLGNAGADICPARRSPVPRVGALPGNSRNSSCARGSDRPPRAAVCRIGLARSARLHRGAPSKR